jgi:hypothetical protein
VIAARNLNGHVVLVALLGEVEVPVERSQVEVVHDRKSKVKVQTQIREV